MWPDYVARVNSVQGLPSGQFVPVETLVDAVEDEMVGSLSGLDDVKLSHFVSWGDFDNGTSIFRVVFLTTETVRVDFPEAPVEEVTMRSMWAVAFPDTDAAASELSAKYLLPVVQRTGRGSMCNRKPTDNNTGFDTHFDDCPDTLAARQAPSPNLPVSPTIGVIDAGVTNGEGATAMEGHGPNAAGILCLAQSNACSNGCATVLINTMNGCNNTLIAIETVAAGCIGAAAVPTPVTWAAGLGCAGATMITGSVVTYYCRESAHDSYQICNLSCAELLQACCIQEGTDCGTQG